ncbi:MAG TPA: HEAT repeat domain-containing protein [Holophagaceae bacterium]|nr:HEAT repeat domain-containing protein [Holophagaceae bacterium]
MPGFPELAQHLTQALKALQMYQAQHPRSQESLVLAQQTLEACLAERSPMQLNVSNGKAFIDGQPQEGASPHIAFIVKQFSERQVAGFVFERGFSADELLGALQTLLLKPAKIEEGGGVAAILQSKGIHRIQVSTTQYREVGSDEPSGTYPAGGTGSFRAPGATGEFRARGASGEFPASGATGSFRAPGASGAFPALGIPPSSGAGGDGDQTAQPVRGLAMDSDSVAALLRDVLLTLLPEAPDSALPAPGSAGEIPLNPPPLGLLPSLGSQLGLGGGSGEGAAGDGGGSGPGTSPIQQAGLRQSLLSLEAPQQFEVVAAIATAPAEAQELVTVLRPMVPELLATAIASLISRGYQWNQFQGTVATAIKPFADRKPIAASTGVHLQGMGYDPGPLGGLMVNLDWEDVSLESKVSKLLEGNRLLEISIDHRLAFLRDLLDKRMDEGFLRGLEQLLEALKSDVVDERRSAAQTLAGVTRWALEPRLPSEAEKLLRQRLPRPFVNETDQGTHRWISEALSEMVLVWVEQGELSQGTAAVEALRTRMTADAATYPWRPPAMAEFEARILSPRGREAALGALFRTEREQLLVEVEPYLRWQGAPMAKRLVERLEQEQDRAKRGRIMDGLRLMADLALPPLEEALKNPSWFLVRNSLLLISELGSQAHTPKVVPLLRHAEPRVCRTAVRAMWKLGGPSAEQALLAHLRDAEPGTQAEILFALGQIHGEASGPALAEIASDRKLPERLRLEVLKALQGMHALKAVPALVELIRRKGLFGAGAESGAIRVAAAQALAAVGTPDAKAQLKRLLDAEPKGLERDVMAKLVAS